MFLNKNQIITAILAIVFLSILLALTGCAGGSMMTCEKKLGIEKEQCLESVYRTQSRWNRPFGLGRD